MLVGQLPDPLPNAALGLAGIHGAARGALKSPGELLRVGEYTPETHLPGTVRVTEGVPRRGRSVCFAPQVAERDKEELFVRIVLQSGQLGPLPTHLLRVETVGVEGLPHSAIVGDVLAQS